jgi:mannosyltransferase
MMPRAVPYQPSREASLAILAAIVFVAAALRLPWLSTDSLWFDEAATWTQVNAPFADMLTATLRDNYPPLYNLVTWPLVQLLGDAEWVLRLPAALLGIALPPLSYLLAAKIGGRSAGLVAATILALSPFHVWYSLEARMYSLLALTATAYALAALRDLEQPDSKAAILQVVTGLALLLSHPFGALDWMAIGLPLLIISRDRWRSIRLSIVQLALFLPFGAALAFHAVEITRAGFWIPEATPGYVLAQLVELTSGLLPALSILAIAAFLPGRTRPQSPALPLLLSLSVAPLLLAWVASWIATPVVFDRYLIGSLPAIVILAAVGATRWPLPRMGMAALGLAVVAACWWSFVPYSPAPRYDWRSATAYVGEHLRPGDCVIVNPAYDAWTWNYYRRGDDCLLTISDVDETTLQPGRRLFLAVETPTLGEITAELARLESRLPLGETTSFPRVEVYTFGPAP